MRLVPSAKLPHRLPDNLLPWTCKLRGLRSGQLIGPGMSGITRREVVRGAAAASAFAIGSPSTPAQNGRRTLRFVPHADLRIVDPVWTTAYVTRNHGYLVFDTLFGTDENQQIKPQMVETTTVSPNG